MLSLEIKGFDELLNNLRGSKRILHRNIKVALDKSISHAETSSKRLTPVDTGLLKSSIGGVRGWSWVRGWRASVGTNVRYAVYVHEDKNAYHNDGEAKFMEKGLKRSKPFIERTLQKALDKTAKDLSTNN